MPKVLANSHSQYKITVGHFEIQYTGSINSSLLRNLKVPDSRYEIPTVPSPTYSNTVHSILYKTIICPKFITFKSH